MSRIENLGLKAKVALSTVSQTTGNVLVALGALAVVRIATHRLGPTDYGTFALIVTYVTLFTLIVDLGVTTVTSIELRRRPTERSSTLSAALSFRIALSLLSIPIILGSAFILYPNEPPIFRVALAVMSIDVLLTSIQVTLGTAFVAEVRGDRIASLNVINRILYVGGVVLVAIVRGSYFEYVCAYIVADDIVAILYILLVRKVISLNLRPNIRLWWMTARVAFPLGSIQIVGSIYLWVDSILVSIFCTKAQLGFYSLSFNVVIVILAMPMFLMQALLPSLVNTTRDTADRLINRAFYLLFCIGVPLAVGGILFRQEAVLVLGGNRFLPASTVFAVLCATIPISTLQTVLGYASIALGQFRQMFPVAILSLVLNITINLALIPRFGPAGAAVALLVSESGSLLATYLVLARMNGIHIHWERLWRPAVAALTVLFGMAILTPAWRGANPMLTLSLGGASVVVLYLIILRMMGGVPIEFRRFFVRR